jgi:hypothetical protein
VQPFDRSLIGAIERAIQTSDLGLNPSNDGNLIRVPIPALTEERRKEYAKLLHKMAEEGKVSIRHARRITSALFVSQSLGSAGSIAAATVAAIVGAELSGLTVLAGVPAAVVNVRISLPPPSSIATETDWASDGST